MGVVWNQYVDPQLKPAFDALSSVVSDAGGHLTLTSTLRTYREQSYLYNKYKAGQSTLPANPPGYSAHEWGWAFDAITQPSDWIFDVGAIWVSWGGAYGGKRDPVHFELAGAGALAWQNGSQGLTPPGGGPPLVLGTSQWGIGADKKGIAAEIAKLPAWSRKYIYMSSDLLLGLVPYYDVVQFVASLIQLGYSDSEIINFLAGPVENLHDYFPQYL
jgi:hypothetical protein